MVGDAGGGQFFVGIVAASGPKKENDVIVDGDLYLTMPVKARKPVQKINSNIELEYTA